MTSRRTTGVLVLAGWLCVVGWHVRREYFRPEAARLAAGARMLAPGAHWYVVKMEGTAIGIAQSRLDTIAGGFTFDDEITLDVPVAGRVQRSLARTHVRLGPALDLQAFRFGLESAIGRFAVSGEAAADSTVHFTMDAGGGAQRSVMRVSGDLLLDAALPLRLAASGGLRVGNEFGARIFDPSTMSERDVGVRITARDVMIVPDSARHDGTRWVPAVLDTVEVFRMEQRFGGVSVATWVDGDGRMVRAESALGFTIERTGYELAWQEWREGGAAGRLTAGYGALIEGTAISVGADLRGVAERPRLAVRLQGVELTGFDLDGGRQRLRGDTLFVEREDGAALRAAWALPWSGGGVQAAELESTPLIQADDPRIRQLARDIAAGATDPVEVAQRLNEWVYRALRKQVTVSVPSALQVLEARTGDCNEHTVLYIALARALGLPARTAAGVVHVRDRFYYHAWPEVWIGDWVAVDPTLGQFPADASHLRFLVGGLARQLELIRLIGRLQLEVT